MKFKFGDFESRNDKGKFTSSLFDSHVNTDNFKPETTLKEVADKVKEYLKMESGEIELLIEFRFAKKIKEAEK